MMKNISLHGSLLLSMILALYAADSVALGRGFRGGYGVGGYEEIYSLERADKQLKAIQSEATSNLSQKEELARLSNEVDAARASLRALLHQRDNSERELARLRALFRQAATKAEADRLARLIAEETAAITHIETRINRFDKIVSRYDELYAKNGGCNGDNFDREIERLKELEPALIAAATGRREMNVGQLVAKGIAGEDFYLFDYGKCNNLWDGLKQGLILGTSKEFGEFVRTKMRGVFQDKLGSIFDATINGLSDGFQLVKEAIFHDSRKPFTESELTAWSTHILSIFEGIEKLTKDGGLRDVYRGQDSTMRQTNNDFVEDVAGTLEGDAAAPKIAEKKVPIWANLFGGYVLQLSHYVLVLQDRKGYYEADSFEVFFATHLEERLKQFCELLLKVNDIADLEAHLAVNRAAIPPYKSNIDNLFKQLQQQVKPRSFSTSIGAATSIYDRDKTARTKSRFSDIDYADDGPQTGWAR